jgi:hypothetical protein
MVLQTSLDEQASNERLDAHLPSIRQSSYVKHVFE